MKGSAAGDSDQVRVFKSSDCSGPSMNGARVAFEGAGIEVTVGANQTTQLSARAVDALGNVGPCSAPLSYREDSRADSPELDGSEPASPSTDANPRVVGRAEAGSTVRLFTSSDCSGDAAANGSAAELADGIAVSVPTDATTQISARATDPIGNVSACSPPIEYTHRSPEAPPPDEPSNEFEIDSVKQGKGRDRGRVATLSLDLPGPGAVTTSATSGRDTVVDRKTRRVGAAGPLELELKLTGKGAKQVRKNGKLSIKIEVAFEPDGGTVRERTKTFVVKN